MSPKAFIKRKKKKDRWVLINGLMVWGVFVAILALGYLSTVLVFSVDEKLKEPTLVAMARIR